MLVVNSGVFPPSASIGDLDFDAWKRTMAINVDANAALLHQAYPLMRTSPRGGRVVVIGSRSVHGPGPARPLTPRRRRPSPSWRRVAALEWAPDGIRVNVIHPDRVFDTGGSTTKVLEQRAAHHGLNLEEYRWRNLLGVEVTSADVARACVAVASRHVV